jgi:hypothetical protein
VAGISESGVYYSGRKFGKNEAALTWFEHQLANHEGLWPVAAWQNKIIGELWAERLAPEYKMEWQDLPAIRGTPGVWYVWRTAQLSGDEPALGGSPITGDEPGLGSNRGRG